MQSINIQLGLNIISVLTTCTFIFRHVCIIEPWFFNMTTGMHRRPIEGRHLVSFWCDEVGGGCLYLFSILPTFFHSSYFISIFPTLFQFFLLFSIFPTFFHFSYFFPLFLPNLHLSQFFPDLEVEEEALMKWLTEVEDKLPELMRGLDRHRSLSGLIQLQQNNQVPHLNW